MAKEGHCYVDDQDEEEGYIDMEINPATCCTAEEFEFQMSSRDPEADHSSTSPADEIFYKGKLLPLHLPPRLQMVETLLLQKKPDNAGGADASSTTPFASCNVSPATSCYVSGELSPEDFFFEEEEGEEGGCPREPAGPRAAAAAKRSWAKKLRSIRLQSSSLGLKLRASKAYIQSLFSKSSSAAKPKECSSKSGHLRKEDRERGAAGGECGGHRRSFSGAATVLKRRSSNKFSSSSSSSCSSSDSSSSSSLKRSSSVSSDKECSVQGAIAHCKRSQQARQAFGRKSVSDVEFYLKSGPRADAEREERN